MRCHKFLGLCIQKAVFSQQAIENLKKALYCILSNIHISYFRKRSYVVFLLMFSNGTKFCIQNTVLFKLRTKNCFNLALLISITPNYTFKTSDIRIFGVLLL